jgi:peptide methionine sulfoxide reductase msrA/msrB
VGDQYRSIVFYRDEAQHAAAKRLIDDLVSRGFRVATRLEPAGPFWRAEEYHQDYYRKTGKHPYCHSMVERFAP